MSVTGPLVSIIDDDPSVGKSLINLMRSYGIRGRAFTSAEAFLRSDSRDSSSCIISDIQMPGLNGFDLKEALDALGILTPVIMITARTDQNARTRAQAAGAFHFLSKPFETEDLVMQIKKALEQGSN